MRTYLQIENQVRRMLGQKDEDSADLRTSIRDAIMEAYRELYEERAWYWLSAESTATATGSQLLLPTDALWVIDIEDSDEYLWNARDANRQREFKNSIESRTKTYALNGVDTSTGAIKLKLVPESTSTFTIYYSAQPTDLSDDTDEPTGPDMVGDWLVWRTYYLRLVADEERSSVIARAEKRSEELLWKLGRKNAKMMRNLRNAIAVPRV